MKRKRTYQSFKEYGEDMSYENETKKFLDDIANNTPNVDQFKEEKKDLGKKKKHRNKMR